MAGFVGKEGVHVILSDIKKPQLAFLDLGFYQE